ncbi:Uncharacterized protein GBIM_05413 [Gryllus bimaculatus]|nr:Uncharacterized protein GBIM_05413 [Gryllus bimaculatus]
MLSTASPRLAPRVPPQTYRWEDLRRIRAQGGYPWTHLTKPPFSDSWEDVSRTCLKTMLKVRDYDGKRAGILSSARSSVQRVALEIGVGVGESGSAKAE